MTMIEIIKRIEKDIATIKACLGKSEAHDKAFITEEPAIFYPFNEFQGGMLTINNVPVQPIQIFTEARTGAYMKLIVTLDTKWSYWKRLKGKEFNIEYWKDDILLFSCAKSELYTVSLNTDFTSMVGLHFTIIRSK